MVLGEGTSRQFRCLLDSLQARCGQSEFTRENVHLATVAKGDRKISEPSGLSDHFQMET